MAMPHGEHLEWDIHGKCKYRVLKERKCGSSTYDNHYDSYTDEYGSGVRCPSCRGIGKITYFKYVRVPEFDAPKPSANWVPDWIEEVIK